MAKNPFAPASRRSSIPLCHPTAHSNGVDGILHDSQTSMSTSFIDSVRDSMAPSGEVLIARSFWTLVSDLSKIAISSGPKPRALKSQREAVSNLEYESYHLLHSLEIVPE